ncbi:rhodanese-like domain-containing protein [Chloroflexus aggregans]|uniref:Rhodanese domain protein n=1 Tax=Chloroflexus aggregans (strain MD-66 / DSM 9485) TaxID=326427 RepID=B8G799_CHLAD|nr:rhodanese-like domain-containing protein [Chloroflexus aggregans]ACL24056.1 Rhodanese domain protein [Chloroflexus aggregans DSM 9485]
MQRFGLALLLMTTIVLTACGTAATTTSPATKLPAEINVARLKTMLDRQENFFLLDVRTPQEFVQDGRIAQSTLIPLQELEQRLSELPTDKPIVCICRSGNRSAAACDLLRSRGFEVINVAGGMRAWAAAGYPMVVGP